jgi:hypothetical protein
MFLVTPKKTPKKNETPFHGAGYWFGDISETFHAQVFNVSASLRLL